MTAEATAGRSQPAAAGAATGGAVARRPDRRPGPRPVDRLRRAPDWLVALAVGALAAALCTLPRLRYGDFYYAGDGVEQFVPLWHHLGEQLRQGHWLPMDPAGWAGGNYAAEALLGIWNPVNLLDFALTSTFDDLSRATFVVMVETLGLLASGVFLLAREYGARRVPAVLVATAIPVSGFTLWYEASGWPAGLFAFTWVTHFWWSARRHGHGRTGPVVPFLFGALAITTGNPYATVGVLVVLLAVGVELLVQRRPDRLIPLLVTGACVGTVALLVFLPLLATGSVSERSELATIANDTFLVPNLGDLAASSSPTYVPAMTNWGGALVERVPSTYLAWFVLPLLPWLRWDRVRGGGMPAPGTPAAGRPDRRARSSVLVVAGCYLAATLGPSYLWLFRWPVRVIEYLYLAGAILFATALSAGVATDRIRQRAVASGAVVAGGGYLAWAVRPGGLDAAHLVGVLGVAALVALALLAHSRRGMAALGVVVVLGTAGVATLQAGLFPAPSYLAFVPPPPSSPPAPAAPAPPPLQLPTEVPAMASGTSTYRGTVLQLGTLSATVGRQESTGQILFGNEPRAVDVEFLGTYTGIGFVAFKQTLCMDYRGATCPQLFDRLWQPAGEGVPEPLIDALRVSTLVLQRAQLPAAAASAPPPGWHVTVADPVRAVWVRDHPLVGPGRVSWSSAGVAVLADRGGAERESVRYTAAAPGRLLFARLAWPGYTARVDGAPVPVRAGPAGLLAVGLPAGDHVLDLDYAVPGLRPALAAVAAAVLVVAAHGLLARRARRRDPVRR